MDIMGGGIIRYDLLFEVDMKILEVNFFCKKFFKQGVLNKLMEQMYWQIMKLVNFKI